MQSQNTANMKVDVACVIFTAIAVTAASSTQVVSSKLESGDVHRRAEDPKSSISNLTGCHFHDGIQFCTDNNGDEVTSRLTGCHFHDGTQYCIDDNGEEGSIVPSPKDSTSAPSTYTDCHSHGKETFCVDNAGREVQFVRAVEGEEIENSEESSSNSTGKNCHFHGGVEHCVGEEHSRSAEACERVDRDYDIPLRIGLLFVIFATSSIAAFGPILLKKFLSSSINGFVALIIKQFGTGVIISTAFVHLMTHAELMWRNSCITLAYESTSTAITMAGIFLAFLVEYITGRSLKARSQRINVVEAQNDTEQEDPISGEKGLNVSSEESSSEKNVIGHDHFHGLSPSDKFSVLIMEAGILFHSILIGVTLVVAGDSYFITLFIVILFHQFFEGLALGARITEITNARMIAKLAMALAFALITPIGMAIGIGVLNTFNGNDPSTIIALGTLDAFSAGVLIWTGLIEMWASDWLFGPLAHASFLKTSCSLFAFIAGMILMSFIGKWA
ncbi:zinc-regulated transporter 2 [Scheffersomyces xylosifermentans]|uniref:zinc-regulated transporter 2 n=1 Tax=Scheffersomyces xylosifermentans TaxID=1304137 RepID=UPI00315DF656